MARKLLTAALILTLALTTAACGSKSAGTSARDWDDNEWAYDARNESWGPLAEGRYAADNEGRVRGYDASLNGSGLHTSGADAKEAADNAVDQAKDTGRDLTNGMKDAARSIGDAAEDALDDMKNNMDNMKNDADKAMENQSAAQQNAQQQAGNG